MKVLLDHNMPAKIRTVLTSHQAFIARERGWHLYQKGDLLKAAEIDRFDALLTADQSIFYQQNNLRRIIALVVLSTNDWESSATTSTQSEALQRSTPGGFEFLRLSRTTAMERK